MGLMDKRTEFADAGVVTGNAAATAILGDVIDLERAGLNIGVGMPLYLNINMDTLPVAGGGAAEIQFKLVSDSTADLATSPTTHFETPAIGKATLAAGYTVCSVALPSSTTYERYLGVTYTVTTNNVTAGKANAWLSQSPLDANKSYPDGIA